MLKKVITFQSVFLIGGKLSASMTKILNTLIFYCKVICFFWIFYYEHIYSILKIQNKLYLIKFEFSVTPNSKLLLFLQFPPEQRLEDM